VNTNKKHRDALRDRIRILKNKWFQTKAIAAEQFAYDKNYREFYSTLNQIYGPRSKNLHPIKSKSKNDILLTSSMEIKDRWVEHFSELLNQPSEVDIKYFGRY